MTLMAVMMGGALGSGLRYWVALGLNPSVGDGLPWGTLLVNVSGCLLIGWLATLNAVEHEAIRLGLLVGVLGGFTTFSSFGLETLRLFQTGQINLAIAYVLLSNAGGIAGAWIGFRLGQ